MTLLNAMTMPNPTFAAEQSPLVHVVDHHIWEVDGVWLLTNHMVMIFIVAALMLLIFPKITKRYRSGELVPTGTRNFFEAIMIFIRNDVAKPVLAEHADRFMPFLWTLFFFILFCNLLGLLPLDSLQAPWAPWHPIYGTATANLYVTGALALFSFVLWHFHGIREQGLKHWAHHFLGGAPIFMAPVMVIVEFIGMLVKPCALAIRLMANMTAGHVMIAVLVSFVLAAFKTHFTLGVGIGITVILGATALMVLELFVAFLQAYIFTFLTALFIGQLVVSEHEHEEHAHDQNDMTDSADLSQYGYETEPAIR